MFPTPEAHRSFPDLDVEGCVFHPVIFMGSDYEVYDFTEGYDPNRVLVAPFGVGRYGEHRPGMYLGEQFTQTARTVHTGIDLAAPAGTAVHAFFEGKVFAVANHQRPYDYGPTLILEHELAGQRLFSLYGHLGLDSLSDRKPGDSVATGQRIATVGEKHENGGWNPHVHFQLSWIEPVNGDLPGAVSAEDWNTWAPRAFPDPRRVLGPLYAD